jgi:ABC-2 type transport system permease protein
MSSTAPALQRQAGAPESPGRALGKLTRTEFLLFVRERVGLAWGVGFPIVLLIIFGSIPSFRKPVVKGVPDLSFLDAYVPVLIVFALAMLALSVLPSVLATYREKGILRRLATTPVGPSRMLAAQLIIAVGMTAVTLVAVLALARIAYHVPLPRQGLGFALSALLATLALVSIGLFFAAVASSGRAASAIGAIAFFPMMFFAGLWFPVAAWPAGLRDVSHATPLGAAVQALQDSWQGHWPQAVQLIVLAAYAVVFAVAAARLFRWE